MTDEAEGRDGPSRPMKGPGARLRERRQELGWTLDHVAYELRVSTSVLASLEDDDYAVLEAPIFVRGHLRNYARLLQLPPEELIEAYERDRETDPGEHLPLGRSPGEPVQAGAPRWVFVTAWLVAGVMLALGAMWWYAGPHRDPVDARVDLDEELAPPEELAEPPPEEATPEADPAETETEVPEIRAERDPDVEIMPESLDTPLEIDAEELAEAQADPEAAATGEDAEDEWEPERDSLVFGPGEPLGPDLTEAPPLEDMVTLRLVFEEESWVEVEDAAGRMLYRGLAEGDTEMSLDGVPPMQVFLGRGPVVTAEVAGQPVTFAGRIRGDDTVRFEVSAPEEPEEETSE